ncbi:MAG: DUF5916 domain-containing protein [Gemmatimonadota bacterium]
MARAGRLTGLPDFRLGLGLTVRPSVVVGVEAPEPTVASDGTGRASLDVTQRLGSNLLASLTLNTDFAETEVDTRQTNLTRFPLLFPEKRTFFLEGSDIFAFGFGTGQDLLPFQSRRLGLVSGTPVPLDVGAKVSGRTGNTNLGLLSVRTGAESGLAPASTMTVGRIRQNVLGESSVGALGTLGDPLGRDGAWTAGTDFTYRTSRFLGDKNFVAAAWGLATGREGLVGERSAWGVALDYPNDLWDIYTSFKRIGDGFDPSLGFVPRRGIQAWQANVTWLPRPGWPWLRYMRNELFLTLVTDLDGAWESYRIFTAPLNWRFESGDRLELNWAPEGERLPEDFEISDGVVIPAGPYHWDRYRVELQLADKRRVNGQFSWWFGEFYGGNLDQYQARLGIRPSATLGLDLTASRNVGELPEGRFVQEVIGSRVRVNVSPDLQLSALVQYDNASERHRDEHTAPMDLRSRRGALRRLQSQRAGHGGPLGEAVQPVAGQGSVCVAALDDVMTLFVPTSLVLAGLLLFPSGLAASPQQRSDPDTVFNVGAARASGPVVVDGVVSDDEWAGAPVVANFIQFEPARGLPSPHRTEVRVLFDSTHLHVAMRAWDADPLTAQLTRRDADLAQDDFFAVILDTFHDRQSGFVFAVNPLGTQSDSRLANDGRTEEKAWDGEWGAAARILDDGWSAEISIPFATLRYRSGQDRTWGINFGRGRRRSLEMSFWTGPLEHPLRVSQAGTLTGLRLPGAPRRLQGIAYGLSRAQEGTDPFFDAGLDLRWALGPGTSLVGTVNPDFATIEADREQINLTRFELGLPEKRPFFLEGSELFRQRIQTFYSRRIADIRAGGRVVGKQGPWTFAFLGADAQGTGDAADPRFAVGRMQRDIGRSSVGATWAERRADGLGQGSAGLDANLFFSSTFGFTGQLIRSFGEYDTGNWGYFLRPTYDSPTGHFHVRYTHLGDRFGDNVNPVGLVRDDNRRELDSALEKKFWLPSGPFEQVAYGSNYNAYWGQDGTLRSWRVDQGLDLELRSRWSLSMDHAEELQRFEKEFRNRSTGLGVGFNTREFRSVEVGAEFGRNFDADYRLLNAAGRLKPTPTSSLEYQLERLLLDPDPEDESTWIHVVRASQFFTNDLYLQLFYQTNSVIERRNLQAVFVYRYAPPFGTVQLAFQRGTAAFGQVSDQGNTLFLKVTRVF